MADKCQVVYSRMDKAVKSLVEAIASTEGITVSEYVRNLIIQDLDKRSVFTTKLKTSLAKNTGDGNE